MPVATQVSLEEYLHTINEPDCEYLDGELVECNMAETERILRESPFLCIEKLTLADIFADLDKDVDLSGT